jgi:transcriptional regulator with XRE-family HTH domain
MPSRAVDARFPERMRELLAERGLSYRALAAKTYYSRGYLHDLATGRKSPTPETARRIDDALGGQGQLAAYVDAPPVDDPGELARRVAASDLGAETLEGIENAVDDMAMSYATTVPVDLLPRVLEHLSFVRRLIDVRMTLTQRRRLVVAGGWLALLAATVHIDLRQRRQGVAHLATARQMAEHAEHSEIVAWCLETRAWDWLVTGDFRRALDLSRQAQQVAPVGSSALIQATAQEGRALARLGRTGEVRDALDRTARLVSPLPKPDRPEHHYRYDPAKSDAYTATTLAWSGDPAAEEYARIVVAELDQSPISRPRRTASARLDLGLALVAAGKPDEASSVAMAAIESGRVVGSNWWRVAEVLAGVEQAGIPEAMELREAAEALRPAVA